MSENNNFSNVQRRHSAVMAKYEWTTSLMNMKKSGDEIHDRRIKTYRKANEFLKELLQKRSDGSLLDDNGTIDRYKKFLKYKSNFNDDDILNEFNRRLRALNKDRQNQISKNTNKESITIGLQTAQDTENDIEHFSATDLSKSLSTLTITSLNNSILSNISFEETQTNTDEYQSSTFSVTKILHKPKARRADGTELITTSIKNSLHRASSNILIFNHCHFPRSLKSREQIPTNPISEKQISSSSIEQYDNNQLYHLLDQIDNKHPPSNFTTMLNQLTLSSVQTYEIDDENNLSLTNEDEDEENIFLIPNLFDQSLLSNNYYTTFDINIDNPRNIFLYIMTISTVQLNPSLIVPYSILNGRRPLLKCSDETNFKKIYSKQSKYTCQITAIESIINIPSLQENDIILKINDQSVWCLTIDTIREILQQSKNCLLTIARLCQPFI